MVSYVLLMQCHGMKLTEMYLNYLKACATRSYRSCRSTHLLHLSWPEREVDVLEHICMPMHNTHIMQAVWLNACLPQDSVHRQLFYSLRVVLRSMKIFSQATALAASMCLPWLLASLLSSFARLLSPFKYASFACIHNSHKPRQNSGSHCRYNFWQCAMRCASGIAH